MQASIYLEKPSFTNAVYFLTLICEALLHSAYHASWEQESEKMYTSLMKV